LPRELRRGDKVFIHSLNQTGVISVPPGEDGEAQIQAGIMKIKANIADLSLDETEDIEKKKLYAASQSAKSGKSLSITREIDLRGLMSEEAVDRAEKYLDDAYLAGLQAVTLIHGKGTGALRNAIQSRLKNHPHVAAYRLGKYGEGENGVTVVELKE
jgi:DNA mismatch repair protein MutS2